MTVRDRLPLALRLYRLASKIAAPPVASRLLAWRLKRGKENPERVGERYGVAGAPRPPGPVIWLHGASVGEVLAVMPLIGRLRAMNFAVLLTSGTVTSAEIARQRLPAGAVHQFIPLDAPRFVARFLDHWRPDLALFVESDLWPNLIIASAARGDSADPGQRPGFGALLPPLAAPAPRDLGAARALRSVPDAVERRYRALRRTRRAARQLQRQSQARRARAAGGPIRVAGAEIGRRLARSDRGRLDACRRGDRDDRRAPAAAGQMPVAAHGDCAAPSGTRHRHHRDPRERPDFR